MSIYDKIHVERPVKLIFAGGFLGSGKTTALAVLQEKFPKKRVMPVSAKLGDGLDRWLEALVAGEPGANTVLKEIDYDRYAAAEAVLGWLNAAVRIAADDHSPRMQSFRRWPGACWKNWSVETRRSGT